MSILDNIISWTHGIPDVAAIDYFGTVITFGELPEVVRWYVNGLKSIGVQKGDVVTLCLPVSVENNVLVLALNKMGAIQNTPNFLFLRSDFKTYTEKKKSDTLILLDAYLPFVIDDLEACHIKNVILTSLSYYLPESKKDYFDHIDLPEKLKEIFDNKSKQEACMKKMATMQSINFIRMEEIIEIGKTSTEPLDDGPVDMDRDVSYSYTSGTTGKPKCIVYKELSANALIELHKGINTKDFVGDRCFQSIPLTHATGERFCGLLQMARGKTMVPQPIYNKDSFGEDLMASKCSWVTVTPSFYLAGVEKGVIAPDAFKHVTRPCSGGEPLTKSNVILIDNWLKKNGCKTRLSIGGGAAEDGSSTITSYFMDERTKTNETGYPVEPGIRAKIVDQNGKTVPKGQRGKFHVTSPAAADRYLDDPKATAHRWYVDKDGIRWGNTEDIAVQNPDGSFNILGRASDSYRDEQGKTKYLFDIEYALETSDPVVEWEISAHTTDSGTYVVGQVILKDEYKNKPKEVIEMLCKKYHLDSVKIYKEFEMSDVTGKRDYQLLKNDKEGYYCVHNGELCEVSYANNKRQYVTKCQNNA
uniref:class I adenylate-forming enzyme family protein n=1 Tax=Eubacterium cellulosolvens TaxID=29322 RepID=UPI000688EAD4|nr:class I adenylate-forming enzyme family protein [[Eubacterium] cellulosolvens]